MTLRLRTMTSSDAEAALAGDAALGAALGGVAVAPGWAVFDEVLPVLAAQLADDPDAGRWGTRLFLLDRPPTLVGWGGFKGAPRDGGVELGYAIAPAFRRRGLASAATALLLDEAYADPAVTHVLAHTLPDDAPSTGVLRRAGFAFDGEAVEGDEPVWRFRHARS